MSHHGEHVFNIPNLKNNSTYNVKSKSLEKITDKLKEVIESFCRNYNVKIVKLNEQIDDIDVRFIDNYELLFTSPLIYEDGFLSPKDEFCWKNNTNNICTLVFYAEEFSTKNKYIFSEYKYIVDINQEITFHNRNVFRR